MVGAWRFRAIWPILAVLLTAADIYFLVPSWSASPPATLAYGVVCPAFALAACLLADAPDQRPNARICLAIAATWTLTAAGNYPLGPLPFMSFLAEPVVYLLLSLLLFRYPSARLSGQVEKRIVVAIGAWVTIGRIIWAVLSTAQDHRYPPGPIWWPTLHSGEPSNALLGTVFRSVSYILLIIFVVRQVQRYRRSNVLDRRLLLPILIASIASAVALTVEITARLLPRQAFLVPVVAVVLVTVPASFLVAAVRRRISRGAVADVLPRLARPISVDELQELLRKALHDPGLALRFWLPQERRYVDTHGQVADASGGDRISKQLRSTTGSLIGFVDVAPFLVNHADVVDSLISAAALALENGRLQTRLRAQRGDSRSARGENVETVGEGPFGELGQDERPLVFLCHASDDEVRVKELYLRLTQGGIRCWLDALDLVPGQDWEYEIKRALRRSSYVVVCLSQSSVTKRGFVQKELRMAFAIADEMPEGEVFLIPLRLEPCQPPSRLASLHWVDLFDASGYRQLTRALQPRGVFETKAPKSVWDRIVQSGAGRDSPVTWEEHGLATVSVFISYQRESAAEMAEELYDRLAPELGQANVFIDVASVDLKIAPGEAILRAVAQSHVMIVLVDTVWVELLNRNHDLTRVEIETALVQERRLVVLLLGDAQLPAEDALPESMVKIVQAESIQWGLRDFEEDFSELLHLLGVR